MSDKCKRCGYCDKCGRSGNPQPYWVWTVPGTPTTPPFWTGTPQWTTWSSTSGGNFS